jgi:hypothetical protein
MVVMTMIKRKVRQISRSRDIVYAFTRHGFGFLVKELGLLDLLAVPKRLFVEGSKSVRENRLVNESDYFWKSLDQLL